MASFMRSSFSAAAAGTRAARPSLSSSKVLRAAPSQEQQVAFALRRRQHTAAAAASTARPASATHRLIPFIAGTALSLGLFAAFLSYDSEGRKVHCEAPPPSPGARVGIVPVPDEEGGVKRKDPATGTELPEILSSPVSFRDGKGELSLVGLGVRTVSFLKVRVYVAGLYIDRAALGRAEKEGAVVVKGSEGKSTEETVRDMLDAGVPFVIRIVPVRSTDFNHLRDGFTRSVQARLKAARKDKSLPAAADEDLSSSLQSLKSLFPPSSLPKGSSLDLVVHPTPASGGRTGKARMALSLEHEGKVLGTLEPPTPGSEAAKGGWSVARELVLAYVADKNEISTPLKSSVTEGLREYLLR
ncbi:hypothetical protein A4X09_0g1475 [Tilletia walkeri]|uniref:Chalcone isomerase domain-containing protein n=1 Tax=Tilletia walkeri TaxID=117179 RepID=A0A8X7NEA6_9BASI|nr:hypothetical protein A4X09_0g1475 [Tilletia walkeri]